MHVKISTGWFAVALGLATATATHAAVVHDCSDAEMYADLPSWNTEVPTRVVKSHGRTTGIFEIQVNLKLDDNGRVVCYHSAPNWDGVPPWNLTLPSKALVRAATNWRFASPKTADGHWISQTVRFEASAPLVRQPRAPKSQIAFRHVRANCYGPCPSYTVTVRGDGRVDYDGGVADIPGKLSYRIPVADAEALITRQSSRDLWNRGTAYTGSEFDASHDFLTITYGKRSKHIHDYLGAQVGMPVAISDAEKDIDDTAGVMRWVHATPETLTDLEGLGFDFHSRRAGDAVVSMIDDSDVEDATILGMISQGAPMTGQGWHTGNQPEAAIDLAIEANRPAVVEALIAAGALNVAGAPDKMRVNSAFQSAMASDSLVFVKRLAEFHPYLTYMTDEASAPQSVLFLAQHGNKAFVSALVDMGADPAGRDGDGNTLLHKLGNDPEVADFLLAHGVDINARNTDGETALLILYNEDAVLHLLDLGADPTVRTDTASIWSRADTFEWKRVPDWLEAHNYHRAK